MGLLTLLARHDPAELAAGVEVLFVEPRRSGYEVRDWRVLHRDGRVLDVSLAMTAMRTPEGDLKGFLSVAIDVINADASPNRGGAQSRRRGEPGEDGIPVADEPRVAYTVECRASRASSPGAWR